MANKELALTIAGIAGFQLLQAWNANAPSLSEVRSAVPGDPAIARQLKDADILIGGTAVVIGTSVAIMSGDKSVLVLMLVMFGTTSLLHHAVLNQEAVPNAY